MCGLIGTVNLPLGRADLDLIAHRGPDGDGLTKHIVGAHQVWLGHRRLAIVDLSPNGAQPMATREDEHVVAFNGEIYNHHDIRLKLPDVRFRGHSDTETLLEALAAYGAGILDELNGIFAFAWLDLGARRLCLARDPFGVKPLYYSSTGNGFCFASEIKPMLRLVPRGIDPGNLATLLKLRFTPSPDTLFRGIHRLRPGHVLEVRLDNEMPMVREYPYIGAVRAGTSKISFDSALGRYGDLFSSAVQRQLMSDVEIGVLLSGGVDSALVASVAQQQSSRRLKAFTVGFKEAEADGVDEIDDARDTAELLGMEHHTVRIGFDDFIASLSECVGIVEEPLATTSIVPMRFLAKLAAQHVKVVLSGQGADEPLGGYGHYQGEVVRPYVPASLARVVRKASRVLKIRHERLSRGLEALSQQDDIGRFTAAHAVFSDEQIKCLTGQNQNAAEFRLRYFYDLLGCSEMPDSVQRMMSLDLRMGLADDLLLYTDKITMRSSLECRVPILDTELVSFIESLPSDFRVRFGSTKIIHKQFAYRLLPRAIVGRRKMGFYSPTRTWFRDADRLRSILLDRGSKFAGFLDLKSVERIIVEHQQGHNRERHIFLLLCLYFWFAEYG